MVMANGTLLVVGGESGSNGPPVPTLEILPQPEGGPTFLTMDFLQRTDPNNLYPFLFVLPSGGVFIIYYNEARILDEITFETTKQLPNLPGAVNNFLGGRTYPMEGTAVMLPQYAAHHLRNSNEAETFLSTTEWRLIRTRSPFLFVEDLLQVQLSLWITALPLNRRLRMLHGLLSGW
jgi:hypothetical protein